MKTMNFLSLSCAALLFVGAACGGSAAPASQSTTAVSDRPSPESSSSDHSAMLAQIDAFLAAPMTADPAPIMSMMTDSDEVMVVISDTVVPADVLNKEYSPLLLAAFAAGNMRAQLESSTKGDQPLVGIRAMLKVYGVLKTEANMSEEPALEAMLQADAEGSLQESLLTP